jgi:hypothetical protein
MALSKKGKKIIIISSITLGALLLLFGIYVVFSLFGFSSSKYMSLEEPNMDYLMSAGTDSYGGFSDSEEMYTDSVRDYYDTTPSYQQPSADDSKIRKSGTVNLTVEDLDKANDAVLDILDGYYGSIVSSYQSGEGNNRNISITIKVPVENFENIYEDIKDIEGEVTYASFSTDDVTSQYTDLESRLKNLEATEEQLVKILETADTVEDTLSVFNQLSSTRSQIEVIKGQLKYLDSQVDYSYLTVNLSLSDVGKAIPEDKWQPLGVLKNAVSALLDLGTSLVDSLIWIVVFSPVVLIPVLVIVLIVKKKAKKKK